LMLLLPEPLFAAATVDAIYVHCLALCTCKPMCTFTIAATYVFMGRY
jgi:hypothetical protein